LNSERSAWTKVTATVVACAVLAACDSLSDVGQQENQTPVAVAHVVGYAAPSSDGNLTIDVRAQSDLVLTGKESLDKDKPIIEFHWAPSNEAAERALITVRNSSTVSVSLPEVAGPDPTPMEFTLTVRDSDGDTDTATVTLLVHPILDANRFLQYVRNAGKLRVVAARAWTADQRGTRGEFDIRLRAHVTYRARSGNLESVEYDVADPVAGSWLPSGDDCTTIPLPPGCTGYGANDFRNPLFQFGIPAVDIDAITRQFQDNLPDSANSIPDPAFVDDAALAVSLILTPRTATPDASLYVLDKNGAVVAEASNGGSGAAVNLRLEYLELDPAFPQVTVTINELLTAGGGLENVDTAISYYSAIDPASEKTTLEDWLAANCIDLAAADDDDSEIAHAVYVNNYDLGFGRDMYFRTASCSTNPGTVASVVINYLTLENAVKKIDPIVAVAMENVDADPSDSIPGVATFYAFAPEQGIEGGTGGFRRVRSVNFDGRGEKFLPGACTMCHGGRPKPPDGLATYAAGADVGATFMPWDLESFLYSDSDNDAEVDQTFPTDPSNANLVAKYSRDAQEAQFKALNLAAYRTYGYVDASHQFECFPATDDEHPLGFAGPCELVELWYGGAGLPSGAFLNDQTPPEWAGDGEELYQDVFARHCRACHTQRVAASPVPSPQFRSYNEFMENRDRTIEQVFDVGGMPGARLTMDRLWQPGTLQDQSAGDFLADHLAAPPNLPPVDRPTPPGDAPNIAGCFQSTPRNLSSDGNAPTLVLRGEQYFFLLRDDDSFSNTTGCRDFARLVSWMLVDRPNTSSAALAAEQSIRSAFAFDRAGRYQFALNVAGPTGDVTISKYAEVENRLPVAEDLSATIDLHESATFDVLNNPVNSVGDPQSTVTFQVAAGSALSASLGANQSIIVTATGVAGGVVNYRITDTDSDFDDGIITVNVAATITANPLQAPQAPQQIFANSTGNEIDLTDLIAAQGEDVVVTIVSTPEQRGTVSVAPCSDDAARDCAIYAPPTATISRFDGVSVGAPDQFDYRACFANQLSTCDTATVTVQIDGRFAFAPVATRLETSCVGCHSNPAIVTPGSVWTLASGAAEKEAWCAVARPDLTGSEDGGRYAGDSAFQMINPASPASSLLYLKPVDTVPPEPDLPHGPTGTTKSLTSEVADIAKILGWIGEGGAFTSASDQTCP
jgi:hypothetical protein